MVWANAAVLGLGGALLTLPIILHFLMQPKPKILEFPALRFVRKRQFINRSRARLKHVVLLLLRCLLILLMAAALAGPSVASREYGQWVILGAVCVSLIVVALVLAMALFMAEIRNNILIVVLSAILLGHVVYASWAGIKLLNSDSAQLLGDSAAPVSALIIVDTSCRMDYRRENKSNLERAKEISRWLIEQFPSESQACVMSTGDEAPFFSVDLGAARNLIDNLEIDFGSLSIPTRMTDGMKLLDEAVHERREIYVVSDLSQKSWESNNNNLLTELTAKSEYSMFVIDVGQESVVNTALSPIELNSDFLTTGGELELSTSVARTGGPQQRSVRFRLERPDKTRPVIRDRKLLVPEKFHERVKTFELKNQVAEPLTFKFSESLELGTHHGMVEIVGDDSFTHDNQRFFTIEVRPAWNVLIVHGRDVTPDNLTDAIVDEGDSSLFAATIVHQNDMPSNLEKFDAVFMLDPDAGISDTTWSLINQYVSRGHGLGIFLGANAAAGAGADVTFQTEAAQVLLTGKLERQWRRPDSDLYFSPENLAHPIFSPFRKWETSVPWNQFPVFKHWSIESDDWNKYPTQTILRYGNGKPAIIERLLGDGRVLIVTTPITEAAQMDGRDPWNALFIGYPLPAWLIVKQISEYLVQSRANRLNLHVGEVARLKNDIRKYPVDYRVFTPRTTQTPAKVVTVENAIKYRFTSSPGQYRLKGNLDEPVLRGFSVNIGDGQTDLTRTQPASIDKILGAGRYQMATDKSQIQRQQGTTRRGQEFYPILILIMLVVLAVEYLMSNRFYS